MIFICFYKHFAIGTLLFSESCAIVYDVETSITGNDSQADVPSINKLYFSFFSYCVMITIYTKISWGSDSIYLLDIT